MLDPHQQFDELLYTHYDLTIVRRPIVAPAEPAPEDPADEDYTWTEEAAPLAALENRPDVRGQRLAALVEEVNAINIAHEELAARMRVISEKLDALVSVR